MKATALLSMFALLAPLAAQSQTPPADSKTPAPKTDLLPNEKAFLNLPEEKRKEFVKILTEANRIYQQKRIIETMEATDKAAVIFKDNPELHNLRGSCYVELRSFDKAMAEFNLALSLAKGNPNIEFNMGEVYFVTKQWQKSIDIFERIAKAITAENLALGRLVEFKIFLCKKKLDKKDEVKALADKYDFLDDSPYYYYVRTILAYDDNDPRKAEEWLGIAGRVFRDPNVIAPWKDTLVEYGYLKGVFGNEVSDETEK